MMDKNEKEVLALVMKYVDNAEEHNIDEIAIQSEIEEIVAFIESLAGRIEDGEFDESLRDAENDRRYHQKKDDEITG